MYTQVSIYHQLLPCWPLMYVMSNYPYAYKYPEFIYSPQAAGEKVLKHKKTKKHHSKKKKYVIGVAETLEYIKCFSPSVFEALTQCTMPHENARKIVRKMINSMVDFC